MKKSNRDRMTGKTAPDSPQSENLPTHRWNIPTGPSTSYVWEFLQGVKFGGMVSGVGETGGISWASLRLNKTNFHGNPRFLHFFGVITYNPIFWGGL